MSTRSYILRENEDGTYDGIYCHHDGYLTYNGALLLDHYNTKEKVDKLLSYGNLSSLAEEIEPNPSLPHNFDNRQDDVCVFYCRDRGEKDENASLNMALEDIDSPESWIEHCYIYTKKGTWKYFVCGHLKEGLKDLNEALANEYKVLGFPRPANYYGFYTEDDIKQRINDYKKKSQIQSQQV